MGFNRHKSSLRNKRKCYKYFRFIIICLHFLNYYFIKELLQFSAKLNFIKECNKIEDYLKLCKNKLISYIF